MRLIDESCAKVEKGQRPLEGTAATELSKDVPGWALKGGSIEKAFTFKGFKEAMAFVERVAALAEREDHHPDMLISYNRVVLTLSTHKIGGLSRNDFILAAKIDAL